MLGQNGTAQTDHHPMFEQRIDALKASVKKLIERVSTTPTGEPSRIRTYAGKATETIKAHPIAAAAIALGVGYVVVRIARR